MNLTQITDFLTDNMVQIGVFAAVAVGVILAVVGISRTASERAAAAARMTARPGAAKDARIRNSELDTEAPIGLSAALVPTNEEERFEVAQALMRAGFRSRNAVAKYYLARLLIGISLPLVFLVTMALAQAGQAPAPLIRFFAGMQTLTVAQYVAILVGIGFFGPSKWLDGRIKKRKRAIEEAFPNFLDLLQVGVEAGMGFDQALLKVATEIQIAAPELAEEVIVALSEIQAGRDRDKALMRLGRRTGLDEVKSFVNVILQSARFGTPVADALAVYSNEMRDAREMRAQEKANKLPVQMSAVMAALMLPALIALVIAPIIIRYLANFG